MKSLRFYPALILLFLGFSQPLAAADAPGSATKPGYTVTVELSMTEEGTPDGIKLVDTEDTSVGEVMSKMALAMAAQVKLPPHEKDGRKVRFTARVPYYFPIEGDEGAAANNGPKPRVKYAIQPAYPLELAEKGESGGAILELVIDAAGGIARLTTLRASRPEFAQAATQAVSQWTFVPAEKDGHPVETRWRMAVVFETPDNMVGLNWRIAPRPSLGSFIVGHNNKIPPAPAAAVPEKK